MEATNETRKAFGKIVTTKIMHTMDGSDLEDFLSEIFGRRVEIGELSNDTTVTSDISKSFEEKYTSESDLKEVEDKMKSGYLEGYYMSNVLSWLYAKGYIPEGNYAISFSW